MSIKQLQEDMALLRSNAETYNGPAHVIAEVARKIETICNELILSPIYKEHIDEAQMKI